MLNSLKKEKLLVIAFDTTAMAFHMEKITKEQSVDGRIIPLPKEIDAGCGAAFATKNQNIEYWKKFCEENKVEYRDIRILEI